MRTALTRRGLLRAGGVAGAAAVVGVKPWADAAAATGSAPSPLHRSSYTTLGDTSFSADGVALQLVAVSDLPVAATHKALAGSEEAFALTFEGPNAQQLSGMYKLANRELGAHELCIVPVEQPGATQRYEVVVFNPTLPKHTPKPPAKHQPGKRTQPPKPRNHSVRRISLSRLRRGVACRVGLIDKARVKRVTVWVVRGDRIVAAGTRRRVLGRHHVTFRFPGRRRARSGPYVVFVETKHRDGKVEMKRQRVSLD
jgi:hypothetical protein